MSLITRTILFLLLACGNPRNRDFYTPEERVSVGLSADAGSGGAGGLMTTRKTSNVEILQAACDAAPPALLSETAYFKVVNLRKAAVVVRELDRTSCPTGGVYKANETVVSGETEAFISVFIQRPYTVFDAANNAVLLHFTPTPASGDWVLVVLR